MEANVKVVANVYSTISNDKKKLKFYCSFAQNGCRSYRMCACTNRRKNPFDNTFYLLENETNIIIVLPTNQITCDYTLDQ